MRHYIFLSTLLLLLAVMMGCTDDLAVDFEPQTGINYRGEPVDAYLDITVGALSVSMQTRADGEDEEEETHDVYDPYEDTEAERYVHDLWIFQYDASDKTLIADPIYMSYDSNDDAHPEYKLTSQDELENLPVRLSNNNGSKSIVYVVTNTGDASWGKDATLESIDGLLADALPTHEPIFVTSETTVGDLAIPMEGNSGEFQLHENEVVTVPVSRMYAKLMIAEPVAQIYVDVDAEQGTVKRVKAETDVYSVGIGNIPLYCRVGTLAPENWDGKEAPTYPDVQWISRAFEASLDTLKKPNIVQPDAGTEGNTYYPYVVYVPENLQGKVGEQDTLKLHQEALAPEHALQLNVVLTVYDPNDNAESQYPYTFYPGADIYTDYNIKRNCVYRVKTEIDALSAERVPSANCLVGIEGHTISFFPYYRVETGGGYDFTSYLDPYGESDAQTNSGAKIDHVGIVWQTKGCIGDNSDGNLVYLTNVRGTKITSSTAHDGYEQIHVHASKEGNALIAAYDTEENILWSWHIWVRTEANGDPTHPANALVYYTYDWDETGIYSYQREEKDDGAPHRRVAGYELMACNLGALQDYPDYTKNSWFLGGTATNGNGTEGVQTFQEGDGIVRTFGMLYQWGRKDPFPPMTTTKGYIDQSSEDAYNSGYYVHNYDDEHTEQLYGNDNTTKVSKTSYNNESYLFHSHIHTGENTGGEEGNEGEDVISGMRYAIAHPTVFLCGAQPIARCLDESKKNGDADYTTSLKGTSVSGSDPDAYVFGGAWSNEDHDNKEWGGLEPSESTMKYYHIVYPSYASTAYAGKQMTDNEGRSISLWDNYDNAELGASKSIFDPCPYGWRVASGDLWIGFARNGIHPYEAYDRNRGGETGTMANINRDPDRSCSLGMTMYLGQEWMTEPSTWFPCQGFILPDGSAYRVGGCGNYVNANTDMNDRVNVVHFHDERNSYRQFEIQTHYTTKSTGNPLRCVRDSK